MNCANIYVWAPSPLLFIDTQGEHLSECRHGVTEPRVVVQNLPLYVREMRIVGGNCFLSFGKKGAFYRAMTYGARLTSGAGD